MFNDQHGMPLPNKHSPLPWRATITSDLPEICAGGFVSNADGYYVEFVRGCSTNDTNFKIHAANWIIPCREIVRRLAEAMNAASSGDFEEQAYRVAADAAKLWGDVQREAKGGGDGNGL